MKIAFIDTLGLCYDGSTLIKRGLGGSESAIILLSRELAKIGFDVTVFNDCTSDDSNPGVYDGVNYCPLHEVESGHGFDVVIASRSIAAFAPAEMRDRFKNFTKGLPDFTNIQTKSKHKVLWMHDTFCDGDDLIESFILDGRIDEIFTLSDFHTDYVTNCDHGRKRMFEVLKRFVFQTRNGIGNMNPGWIDVREKDPDLFVYNASYTKGMVPLVTKVWPLVKQQAPNAKLTVIGGYYRFRSDHGPDQQEKDWRELVNQYGDTINFTGVISQQEISDILRKASYMIYPPAFPETFGISTLEALAHNVPVITSNFGALEETAIDSACYKIQYPIEPNGLFPWIPADEQVNRFVSVVMRAYNDKYLHQQKMYACNAVKDICGWDTVALQWKQHLFKKLNQYLPVDEYRKVQSINYKVRKTFGRRFLNMEEVTAPRNSQKQIGIVTPVYNAENYIDKCILSVAAQDYDNYTMWIVDDCSTDNTVEVAKKTIDSLPKDVRLNFILIENKENVGAVANHYKILNDLNPEEDFYILLDGDDWLVNDPNIFHMYNNLYHDGAEFTYGSCMSLIDNIPLVAQPYPPEVKANKTYRDYKFAWNMPYTHLRTFHAKLLKGLKEDNLKIDGKWPKAGGDTALFYYLIEKADPDKVVCVPDIVYNYNDLNPINDYKINSNEQTTTANKVLANKSDNMVAKKKILIAIPCKNDIEADTFKSIYDLEVPEGYETTFQYFYGYAVDQVRNLIADWTVKGYDYLFAVDHDMVFGRDTLKKLLAHDKDVVSGVYRQRLENQILEVYDSSYRNWPASNLDGRLHEVGAVGFGCVLVKKHVLGAIGYPQFVYHQALEHINTVSEDVDFCRKARSKGFRIWADTSILCDHIGQRVFKVMAPAAVPKESQERRRLRELHDMDLLPQKHVDYLWTMKVDQGIEPKVVYDIGACVLHWTNKAKQVWPDAEFIPFEAMSAVEFLYKEAGFENFAVGCVLTDKTGEVVEFYENTEHPGGNSIYKENPELSPLAEQLFPETSKKSMRTNTLDDIIKLNNLPCPDLIKMDIQGAELKALKGAAKALEKCEHLILELQHTDYNFGAPKWDEVVEYLTSIGFEMVGDGMFCGSDLGVDGDYHFIKSRP